MGAGEFRAAPEWEVSEWLNVSEPLSLSGLQGRVLVVLAFQMLCPGCVQSSLPQLKRVHETFDRSRVAAIGLHTVFEHHAAMSPTSLRAFLGEYRLDFPVAVDQSDPAGGMPLTMRRYQMQGTPTLILVDALGRLRQQSFGHETDLRLGASIMALMLEAERGPEADAAS
jgi:peroxiredoxin